MKKSANITERMRDEIMSRCGETRYCLRLWGMLNPSEDFNEFIKKLTLDEVARQLEDMDNPYKESLTDKSVSGILNSAKTWETVRNLVEETVKKTGDEKLLDIILNRSLEGGPNI